MKNKRRRFLKLAGLTGIGFLGNPFKGISSSVIVDDKNKVVSLSGNKGLPEPGTSIIGDYGEWAVGLNESKLPSFSFRQEKYSNDSLKKWRKAAKTRLKDRMAIPDIGAVPEIKINKQYTYDGLHIEELSWQLPYGRPTQAILLKPANSNKPLPGILAFHDHGGNKYFGVRKITKTSDEQHPLIAAHQEAFYEGMAWANEIAKRGYIVLVADAFTFASRRVLLQDVPEHLKQGLDDDNPEDPKNIASYNEWASDHEHIMAKSLFSAGTTWPGVFFAEDRIALDILCTRPDIDATQIGCCGLSGGGLRTVYMAGQDERIKCAVCVGFMSTWRDFIINKSYIHTWMTYVPLLPNELSFPEILGLRVPLPTLVLNNNEDQIYTLDEMRKADKILAEVYNKAKAGERYRCSFHPGLHKFDKKMQSEAFDWFDKWLKK